MQWIGKCLNSLVNSLYKVHIVVIDNASEDNTVAFIQHHFPEVTLLRSERNLGFGGANNMGLKKAMHDNADYVFLLNQDAWVEPDTISDLISIHRQHPALGIVSPLHLNGKGNDLDQYFRKYLTRSNLPQHDHLPVLINTQFVNAAAWLISMDCVKATGGFAPVFFHYGEDDNYAQRVLCHGFGIAVYTQARIYHDREERIMQNNRTQTSNPRKDFIIFLNQACDVRKPGFAGLWLRRCARYALLTCLSVFNGGKRKYNITMACRVAGAVFKIRKTRMETSRMRSSPYLLDNKLLERK
jgi:GT2 family glycosyltransferase